ncbi:carboxypeptidase-like regulatory domain-containing protein [Zhongshania sp.]|uniref:carboxypeptidase-like regulatory domain-containing protein n=1 Tax=Zhongshania sp. TaxID=1971902 RepID=UPI0035690DC9
MALGIIYDDVTDSSGNAIANIDVTIYIAGTVTKASLFDASEGGSPISNPVQTNDQGVFSAYVAAGDYDVSVDAPGGTVVRPNVTVADGDDIADLLSVRELGAITSADKVTYDGESATVDVALDARVPTVATWAALQAITGASTSDIRYVDSVGRFKWDGSAWQPIDRPLTPQMFGAAADGVTDDYQEVQSALDTGLPVTLAGLPYACSQTLTIPAGGVLNGDWGEILVTGSSVGVVVSDGGKLERTIIRSNVDGTRKGNYGVLVSGDDCDVNHLIVKDMTFSAVSNAGADNRIRKIYAYNCGWDCVQNFNGTAGPFRGVIENCIAHRTGRHGFSTDPNAVDITIRNCVAIDVGDPSRNEGKDSFHFEGCTRSRIENCRAFYTDNHPVVTEAAVNEFKAFRNEAAKQASVDGLEMQISSGFTFFSGGVLQTVNVIGSVPEFRMRGFEMINKSSVVPTMNMGNTTYLDFIEFSEFKFIGPHAYSQSGISSGAKIMRDGEFRGTGAETAINHGFITKDREYRDIHFENLAVGMRVDGFQSSAISGCTFKDISGDAIDIGYFSFTATYRPNGGMITGNHFLGAIGTILKTDSQQGRALAFTSNVIEGTVTTGHAASNSYVMGFGNYVSGTLTTPETGTNITGAMNANLNNTATL